jgi:5-methylcytosine-specific restriction protein B
LEQSLGVREGAAVWKLSLSEANDTGATRQYCLDHDEARIGWSAVNDIRTANLTDPALGLGPKDQATLSYFAHEMQVGDVVLCLRTLSTIRAVGVVSGDYEYQPQVPISVRKDYVHKRAVRWLATELDFDIRALNGGKQLTQPTVYPLLRMDWPALLSALRAAGVPFAQRSQVTPSQLEPYVLVIDEINRGNISRIFGELITLIEPSKRTGAPEALEVVLPYSKRTFSVPDNVYLIGTMNTADRSLTSMDVALRRRFDFIEMPPKPEELKGINVEGIEVDQLLDTLNQRIEALLDRDHRLGHAFFMPLREQRSLEKLGQIFRKQVLPLLQEYFFDDWQRIQWVLNDHRKPQSCQFVQAIELKTQELFGTDVNVTQVPQLWSVNTAAFDLVESYLGVIDHRDALDAE